MSTDPVRKALTVVLDRVPVSIRELARRADIPHSTLSRVRDGEFSLSPEATRKVVKALREMQTEMGELAYMLEKASRKRGTA